MTVGEVARRILAMYADERVPITLTFTPSHDSDGIAWEVER